MMSDSAATTTAINIIQPQIQHLGHALPAYFGVNHNASTSPVKVPQVRYQINSNVMRILEHVLTKVNEQQPDDDKLNLQYLNCSQGFQQLYFKVLHNSDQSNYNVIEAILEMKEMITSDHLLNKLLSKDLDSPEKSAVQINSSEENHSEKQSPILTLKDFLLRIGNAYGLLLRSPRPHFGTAITPVKREDSHSLISPIFFLNKDPSIPLQQTKNSDTPQRPPPIMSTIFSTIGKAKSSTASTNPLLSGEEKQISFVPFLQKHSHSGQQVKDQNPILSGSSESIQKQQQLNRWNNIFKQDNKSPHKTLTKIPTVVLVSPICMKQSVPETPPSKKQGTSSYNEGLGSTQPKTDDRHHLKTIESEDKNRDLEELEETKGVNEYDRLPALNLFENHLPPQQLSAFILNSAFAGTGSMLSANTTPNKQMSFYQNMEPRTMLPHKMNMNKNLFSTHEQQPNELNQFMREPQDEENILSNNRVSQQGDHTYQKLFSQSPTDHEKSFQLRNSPKFADLIGVGGLSATNQVGKKRAEFDISNADLPNQQDSGASECKFQTPHQANKRRKLDPYHLLSAQLPQPTSRLVSSNDFDPRRFDLSCNLHLQQTPDPDHLLNTPSGGSGTQNQKFGLKVLSVRVRELVEQEGETTYKDVANELIRQYREIMIKDGLNPEVLPTDIMQEDAADAEELSEEASPDKKPVRAVESSGSGSKKGDNEQNDSETWERNIRRRVYDALNVLQAANVLVKKDKKVRCHPDVLKMSKEIREQQELQESKVLQSIDSPDKRGNNPYEQKLRQQIEDMKKQIEQQKQMITFKRQLLSDNFKNFICYKHLIERNRHDQELGAHPHYCDPKNIVHLPFILIATKDTVGNEIELNFSNNNESLNIATKQPLKCIGDVDALMKLKFFRAEKEWLLRQIPQGCERILSMLTEEDMKEIFV